MKVEKQEKLNCVFAISQIFQSNGEFTSAGRTVEHAFLPRIAPVQVVGCVVDHKVARAEPWVNGDTGSPTHHVPRQLCGLCAGKQAGEPAKVGSATYWVQGRVCDMRSIMEQMEAAKASHAREALALHALNN